MPAMTGTRHAGFPRDGDTEVEARLVEAETGAEAFKGPGAQADPGGGSSPGVDGDGDDLAAAERERLQREARRAYEEAGGVTTTSSPSPPSSRAHQEASSPSRAHQEAPGSVEGDAQGDVDPLTKLAEITSQRDEYLEALQRVQAEFENYRKRVVRNEALAAERATDRFVSLLLPVLDTLELAQRHVAQGQSVEGAIGMIASSLAEVLGKEGLERIDPEGEAFDPAEHEAVVHEPGGEAEGAASPRVTEVLRAGYRFKGRVLRPAMVRVRG